MNQGYISPNKVRSVSEFLENKKKDVYGFTLTLKSGEIRNFFIKCDLPRDSKKLEELKKFYHELKKPNENQ